MSSVSSPNENEYSHRQGSVVSLPEEDDQITFSSEMSQTHPPQSSSSSNGYSQTPNLDQSQSTNIEKESQIASIDLQTVPDTNHEDHTNGNWQNLSRDIQIRSQSNSTEDELTTSFGFQQMDQIDNTPQEIDASIDYETIIRSQKLYFDPDPELIRKPQMITPLIYKQNIKIKFLKPPPVPLGPLIIKEVRPPQPPPPPPLIIRQSAPPPLSLPPLILREKPPRVPAMMTTQVLTKTLPPVPPPPRSVIIEKLPPLPPKPRDIIIERWIPYEATTYQRKVIVQRAEEVKAHPPPRNVIITYDKVEAKVVRQLERQGITPADPENYTALYGNSLLETNDLLTKLKELGITENLSLPDTIDQELNQQLSSNLIEQNLIYENSFQSKRTSNASYASDKVLYTDLDNNHNPYAATYENLINGSSAFIDYDQLNEHVVPHDNHAEDLSIQLAQYGLTKESIPF